MSYRRSRSFAGIAALGLAVPLAAAGLVLERTVPLPGVEGRIDHFSLDPDGARLFVAALGNNTVEVVDLRQGRVVRSLTGFAEPQGVLYLPGADRLYVAGGGDGTLRIFDGKTYAALKTISLGDDADNLRYDPVARQVYVGYGTGALGVVDAVAETVVADVPLGVHPESFQLAQTSPWIYVNLPRAHAIGAVDRAERKLVAKWSTGMDAANYPMALDEALHRLFVACRQPARLLVFDTETGKETARLDLHGDCDDLFCDAAHGRLYASCGEGFIDIFEQNPAGRYERVEAVRTEPRARTCHFNGAHLYLAVPRREGRAAEIRCYRIEP